MKHLTATLLIAPLMAQGHSSDTDTMTIHELGEITVVAEAQHTGPTATVYMPTKEQMASATDGVSLLSRMQIPQLQINPITESIRTVDNQSVVLFINYHQATAEDINGLNPKDVKRVEYLDFPTDPRFTRAQHVVNFITQTYVYGGYTKLNGKGRIMVRGGDGSVYSKFAFHQMEYDLMVAGNYDYNPHSGNESKEIYRLPSGTIRRESKTEAGRHHNQGLYTALRATWNKSENLTWLNHISYHRINTPINTSTGIVNFSSVYPEDKYSSSGHSSNNAMSWESELYAALKKGWSINGRFEAEYLDNSSATDYTTMNTSIVNKANENSWWLRGTSQINKSLSQKITLFTSLSSAAGHTKINYSGSSHAINRFRQTFTGLYAGLSMNFQKISGSIDGGFAIESNYINGKTMFDRYPFTHINVQYAPDQKNSLGVWFQYATMSPDATMKNPNIIQQSEMMYISGNPDLKCSRHISANISYIWLPNNRWQMSAYMTAFRIINRQIAVYSPDGPDGMLLKKYQNDGDYNHGQIGASATVKFFDGKLTFSLAPRLLLYKTTGSNRISHYPLTSSLSANYYLGKFFFNIYWESESSYVDGETAYLRKMPMVYSVGSGWVSKGWNLQVSIVNPFNSSWEISRDSLNTQWFDSSIRQFGADFHRQISLNVSYTFNYGKKVSTDNEISGEGGISSSILR